MITPEKAYKFFKKAHPDLKVTEAALFRNEYYIFVGVEDENIVDYNDPYYAVDTKTGEIYNYCPINDIDDVNDAFVNHNIDVSKLK